MPESYNYVSTWDFSEKHVDPNIGGADTNSFLSSARCLIYAKPSSDASSATSSANFKRIGVVQGFAYHEQKDVSPIFELGSDIPYMVPGRTQGQVSLTRVLLSGEDLFNLVYNTGDGSGPIGTEKYITTLRDNRLNRPFDLLFVYYGSDPDANSLEFKETYSRLFKGCLFQSRSESLSAGQIIVAEQLGIMYTHIASVEFIKNKSFRE